MHLRTGKCDACHGVFFMVCSDFVSAYIEIFTIKKALGFAHIWQTEVSLCVSEGRTRSKQGQFTQTDPKSE